MAILKQLKQLKKLKACDSALEWVRGNKIKTPQEAWNKCERSDWMLWAYSRTNPENIKERILVAGYCANTVRHLMKDERSIAAVDAAIAFGEGESTKKELKIAAYAAAYAAAADAAAAAAYAKIKNQKETADICRKYLKPNF